MLIDLADVDLPQIDEPVPPIADRCTQQRAQTVATYDGYEIVPSTTSPSIGVLKNALHRVCAEWTNKAAGIVSYGVDGGLGAVKALLPVLGPLPARRCRRRSRPQPAH